MTIVAAAIIESSRIGGYFQRGFLFVLGPIAASFVHLMLSPKREYDADREAAALCDSPHGLADGLIRLEQSMGLVQFQASPATEPLYTADPFANEGLAAQFQTHPPLGERVRAAARPRRGVARPASGSMTKGPFRGPCLK